MTADDAGESLKGLRNVMNCPSVPSHTMPFPQGKRLECRKKQVNALHFIPQALLARSKWSLHENYPDILALTELAEFLCWNRDRSRL